jgi:hypothetical protein
MKPLNEKDSKRLFYNRIYGSEDGFPSQFEDISAEILKKCGGLPLAIITIASLLACRPERLRDEWETIRNSLGTELAINPTMAGMKCILNLSYQHPLHLRACFLHLGMYPEDHVDSARLRGMIWFDNGLLKAWSLICMGMIWRSLRRAFLMTLSTEV